jgi:phosphoserine phosphatase RsbU/P
MAAAAAGDGARRPSRAVLLGVALPLFLGAALMTADLLEGDRTQYVGVLVACPFLAASFVGPLRTVLVGSTVLTMGAAYAAHEGVGTSRPQLVRLMLIATATVIAAAVARERIAREGRLVQMATIAEVAQRTVLRPLPATVGDAAIGVRYISAVAEARIGGDFYEAVDGPAGTRLLVGDVRGKGLAAVRLASAVAGGFRTLAPRVHDLAALVRELEVVVRANHTEDAPDEEFVTAVLVELGRPGTVRVLSCGHPLPLLLLPSGEVRELQVEPDLPLGLGVAPSVVECDLPFGARLLLHTDGATDVRRAGRPDGAWFPLHEAVARMRGLPLDAALDQLQADLREWGGGRLPDDAALLLVEPVPAPAGAAAPAPAPAR